MLITMQLNHVYEPRLLLIDIHIRICIIYIYIYNAYTYVYRKRNTMAAYRSGVELLGGEEAAGRLPQPLPPRRDRLLSNR